jgi:hypothetical protein
VPPATEAKIRTPDPRPAFRPTVLNGARPAFDLEKMTAVMEAFEDYVDASFIDIEGPDLAPAVSDEALDIRLASL